MPPAALRSCLVILSFAGALRAEGVPDAFFSKHCIECHDAEAKKGGFDLTALKPDFGNPETFAHWVKVHDRIESGEMPPKKKERPPVADTAAALQALRNSLTAADKARLNGEGR